MKKSSSNRILYLVQLPPPYHGVSLTNQFVYNNSFINAGYEQKLLQLKFSDTIEQLRRFGLKKLIHFVAVKINLIRSLLFFRPGLVYFSFMPVGKGFYRDCVYLFLIKIFGVRVILHLNNRGIPRYTQKWWMMRLYRMAFRNTVMIHVTSGLLEREVYGIKNVRPAEAFVVPNTTLTFPVKPERGNEGIFRILFLSNLFPEKGLMILLEALKDCRDEVPGIRLMVYGGGRGEEVQNMYSGYIEKHSLNRHVSFMGPAEPGQLGSIYSSVDLFVFPSYFREECFPLVLLEAMQAGLPIVATRIGGIPEMLVNEKEAILISPGNSGVLAGAILRIFRNPDLGRELGEAARTRFFREYSMPHFEKRMRKIFESCLSPGI